MNLSKFTKLQIISIIIIIIFTLFNTGSLIELEASSISVTWTQVEDGEFEDYFIVDSIEKLYLIRENLSRNYLVSRNLDFQDPLSYDDPNLIGDFNGDGSSRSILDELSTGSGWLPVPGSFTGSLVGSGTKTINNLTMNLAATVSNGSLGFFQNLGNNARINQLIFENTNVTFTTSGLVNINIGIIAGSTASSSNVTLSGVSINGYLNVNVMGAPERVRVGSFVGYSTGFISFVDGVSNTIINVSGSNINSAVGGIVGTSNSTMIIDRVAYIGTIHAPADIGGLLGDASGSVGTGRRTINDSYVDAEIIHTGTSINGGVGGLIGVVSAGSVPFTITNSYSTGSFNMSTPSTNSIRMAGIIGGENVAAGVDGQRVVKNTISLMTNEVENSSNKFKFFGSQWYSTSSRRFKASDLANIFVVSGIKVEGVNQSEREYFGDGGSSASPAILILPTLEDVFSEGRLESIVGSGSNSWTFESNSLPLLKSSTDDSLLPFQIIKVLRDGVFVSNVGVQYFTGITPSLIEEIYLQGDILTPPDIIKDGHALVGWFTDPELTTPFNFSDPITTDLTLYAKWELTTFTISFNSAGGSEVDSVSGNEGDQVSLPTPSFPNYRFEGWVNEAGQLVANPYTVQNTNEIFTATWTYVTFSPITRRPLERTLHLNINGPVVFEYGDEVSLPTYDAYELFGSVRTPLNDFVTVLGEVGSLVGDYNIIYILEANGQRVIEEVVVSIVDTTPPVIKIEMPESISEGSPLRPVITAVDNAPGEVQIDILQDIDTTKQGTQTLLVRATDGSGNVSEARQQVIVRAPEMRLELVMVNTQQLLFVVMEHLMDFASMMFYMAQGLVEPAVDSSEWVPYENIEFISQTPGDRIFLMLRDAFGNVMTRESIELFVRPASSFVPETQRGEVVYPTVVTRRYIPWPLVGGISLGTISTGGLIWFIVKKKK